MSNRYLRRWEHAIERPRSLIRVVPVIAYYSHYYESAGQAATTIAWIMVNNQFQRDLKKFGAVATNQKWDSKKERKIYLRCRIRVMKICDRMLGK